MQNTMGRAGYVSDEHIQAVLAITNIYSQGMFFMFGSFCFLMGIFVFFFVPETKGLSLEKMDELFGVTDTLENKLAVDTEAATPQTSRDHHDARVKE